MNDEVLSLFTKVGVPLGKGELITLDNESLTKAHHYILTNCKEIAPYIEQHISELKAQYPRATPRNIQVRHNSSFQTWFAHQVSIVYEYFYALLTFSKNYVEPVRIMGFSNYRLVRVMLFIQLQI
ncbi:hypothetical protein LINPERHAP1_LOCUS26792 [Linum perenne]